MGTWLTFGGSLHDRQAQQIVRRAFDLGINFFDTADAYEMGAAEEQLAAALEGVPRKDYVLASKVFFPTGDGPNDRGLSRKHIFETVEASLRRLKTDYIELFQCHRFDPETPVDETVRAFDDLIRQGKIHYWGVSAWEAGQIDTAVQIARGLNAAPPITNQPAYSLLNRSIEGEILPACIQHGLGILPFSPLAQGVLTGKYVGGQNPHSSRAADTRRNRFMGPYFTDDAKVRVEKFVALAAERDLKPAELAIAWLLHRHGVSSVIVGASNAGQIEQNARAAELSLPDEFVHQLSELFPRG